MNCCCTIEQKILCICRNQHQYFFNKPNVVGVGLGYKVKNGFYTNEKCIVVLVSKKVPYYNLTNEQIIPLSYKGITTDVIESGVFTCCGLTKRIRPVKGGYSISIYDDIFLGTMGCLVTDDEFKYILSNNHVIANENKASIGTAIIQPSLADKGKFPQDTIANLSKFVPLNYFSETEVSYNFVDCAMAKLKEPNIATADIEYVGKPKGIEKPRLNENVIKVGSTTEKTTGRINVIGTTMKLNFRGGTCFFYDQTVTTKMTRKGDSGSILLNDHKKALGILCGDSESKSTFCPIDLTLDLLGVKLVTS